MAALYPSGKRLNDSLYSLYEPPDPDAEFVFFHGIVHDACENMHITAWTTSSGICWPAEWLHSELGLERARIFTVNYDSSLIKTDDAGLLSMHNLTENLAQDLISCGNIGQKGLPVVLIGYDLGGLVIKALCVYLESEPVDIEWRRMVGNFLTNVRGMFYFSTPHQGAKIADGSDFDGELAEYVKLFNARTAQMNGKFQKIRRGRKWKTGGLGHLLKDRKGPIRLPEATMRYDTDSFMMTQETWEAINKPNSPQSSSFQFFLSCVRSFIEDHLEEESSEEYEKYVSTKVGLRSSVDQVVSLFSSLEKAEGNVSGVVLHGMGGIGKSTLGDAVFLKLRKKFDPDCRCSVDREAIVNPTRPLSKLQRSILRSLTSGSKPDADRKKILKALKKCYRDANRRLLIFIDNIESAHDLDDIFPDDEINLPPGSYILIASRSLEMCSKLRALNVRKVCSYAVQELDERSAQKLFLRNAVIESNGIQQEEKWRDVRNVLDACSGLPLALKVTGAALAGMHSSDWGDTLDRLKDCLPFGGTKEDSLWRSLEFSYNQLERGIQRVFRDIVFCFNGSPWNELKVLYGQSLGILEQKALITKDKRLEYAPSLRFPTVKVHSLFVALGEKEGKALGSHLKLNVKQDRDAGSGRGFSFLFDFVLSHVYRPTVPPNRNGEESRCDVLVLDGNPSNFSYPDGEDPSTQLKLTKGKAQFPASGLRKFARSLRILILRDVIVCGMLGRDTIPENLECFICSNSNVPFRGGDLTSLKNLKHLEITTAVDTNDTYKFPDGVRKVRLENKNVKLMMFGAGGGSDSLKRLEEFGLMSVNNLLLNTPVNQFKTLKKVVLRDISGLDNNLPEALFQMESLQSLSIQYCEHVSLLPDVDMGSLEHLHLALPALIRLPDSLQTLRSLRSLTLENCWLLRQLPAGIGTPLTPRLRLIAINRCPYLSTLPSAFHEAQTMKESDSSVLELQLPNDWTCEWHYYTKDELDSTLVEDTLAATSMPPLINQRLSDSVYLFYAPSPQDAVDIDIIFFHGLHIDASEAYRSAWTTLDGSEVWPERWLPRTFPRARITSVSYDAAAMSIDTEGMLRLSSVAEYLMADILKTLDLERNNCPVILVGHSCGGAIIRTLCLYAYEHLNSPTKGYEMSLFLRRVGGIFFYGASHRYPGMFDDDYEKYSVVKNTEANKALILFMSKSYFEMNLSNEFLHPIWRHHRFGIMSLVEKSSPLPKSFGRNWPTGWLTGRPVNLDEDGKHISIDADYRFDDDEFVIIGADHSGICKPESTMSESYQLLVRFVQQTVENQAEDIIWQQICRELEDNWMQKGEDKCPSKPESSELTEKMECELQHMKEILKRICSGVRDDIELLQLEQFKMDVVKLGRWHKYLQEETRSPIDNIKRVELMRLHNNLREEATKILSSDVFSDYEELKNFSGIRVSNRRQKFLKVNFISGRRYPKFSMIIKTRLLTLLTVSIEVQRDEEVGFELLWGLLQPTFVRNVQFLRIKYRYKIVNLLMWRDTQSISKLSSFYGLERFECRKHHLNLFLS